jgi:hypothetical protein
MRLTTGEENDYTGRDFSQHEIGLKEDRGLAAALALFGADKNGSGATPTCALTREDRRQIERDLIRQQTALGARS